MSSKSLRAALAVLAAAASLFAADYPKVIRIAYSGAGTGGRPLGSGTVLAIAHQLGTFEKEFQGTGTKIEWNFFPGAGPATNEALANGLIDVAYHGDLPLIVGRSTGLKHKIVLGLGRYAPIYFVVPSESQARSLADLKGKRLAVFKGTAGQLTLNRVLNRFGFTERDFKLVNSNTENTKAGLATAEIDGAVTSPWDLQSRGIARILFEIPKDPKVSSVGTFWVTEDFEKKYPEATQKAVNALVKAAHFASEEKNRDQVFKYWAAAGSIPYADHKKTWEKDLLKDRNTPLLDEYYVTTLQRAVTEARQFKLIRRDVSLAGWIERKYLDKAIKDLGLEGYWEEHDANGNKKVGLAEGSKD